MLLEMVCALTHGVYVPWGTLPAKPHQEPRGRLEAASAWPLVGIDGDEVQSRLAKKAGGSERREELGRGLNWAEHGTLGALRKA